ncbi:hypothetical protein [Nannocystis pusilla]|uniref:hypothetical protein n=1 Tax=Nannocystis pusilla TaxID=889268 RepID=UPI003B76B015
MPHFLNPAYAEKDDFDGNITYPYAFCTCPDEQKDNKGFDLVLFVEDQDEEARTREAKDKIYAALLLDVPQGTWYPYDFADYLRYYDPERQLDPLETPYKPAGRRNPQLRQLVVGGDQTGIDLCNGGRTRLSKGFHTLTVMVSDRPWFKPDGLARQVGVPDMDNGATYDSTHYVFSCDMAPPNDDQHDCFRRCREKESS